MWIAGLFLCGGMLFFIFSLIGFYRLNYVMNRIHAAALADTLGLGLVMVGLMILGKDVFHIAKHLLVLFFFLGVCADCNTFDWKSRNVDECGLLRKGA